MDDMNLQQMVDEVCEKHTRKGVGCTGCPYEQLCEESYLALVEAAKSQCD